MKKLFDKEFEGGNFIASLDDDRLKLYIDIILQPGHEITVAKIVSFFDKQMKQDLLDRDVLKDVVANLNAGKEVKKRRIAKGSPPNDGRNGKLVFLIKPYGKETSKTEQIEDSNLRELHLFDNVFVEQTIARVYPPKPGDPGVDALGFDIPSKPGNDYTCQHDKSIEIREPVDKEPYKRVVALKEGYLFEENGKLTVKDELTIKGDVDYRIGNLDFIGKIIIKGDVANGFRVKAKQGIEVGGSLQGGTLISSEGNIEVKGPAFGAPGEKIVATGEVHLNMAQELQVESNADIYIKKEARECILRAHSKISGVDARIFGGKSLAVCGMEAKTIGSEAGAPTEIYLCTDVETSAEYADVLFNIANHEKGLELLKVHLGPFALDQSRLPFLQKPHRVKIETLLNKYKSVLSSYELLLEKRKKMMKSGVFSETTQVNVVSKLWKGVKIFVGEHEFDPKGAIEGPKTISWNKETEDFDISELKPIICNFGVNQENVDE